MSGFDWFSLGIYVTTGSFFAGRFFYDWWIRPERITEVCAECPVCGTEIPIKTIEPKHRWPFRRGIVATRNGVKVRISDG